MSKTRIRAVVSGYVQGVGYRFFVIDKAKVLGIHGIVKNISKGNVEVIAEGDKSSIDQFTDLLKDGPLSASVKDVHVSTENYLGEYSDFRMSF